MSEDAVDGDGRGQGRERLSDETEGHSCVFPDEDADEAEEEVTVWWGTSECVQVLCLF